jgi:ubiquinone/menaquinone biosynthesis C-methylase UbiE
MRTYRAINEQFWKENKISDKYCGDELARWLLSHGPYFQTALDIGCGNGSDVDFLRAVGKDAVGVDLSRTMWAFLKKKDNRDHFLLGDASDLPYAKDSFDLVYSFEVLEHLPAKEGIRAVDEIYRVTRKYFYGTISNRREFKNKFHLNVQSRDWWDGYFRRAGFKRIYTDQFDKVNSWIFCYEK